MLIPKCVFSVNINNNDDGKNSRGLATNKRLGRIYLRPRGRGINLRQLVEANNLRLMKETFIAYRCTRVSRSKSARRRRVSREARILRDRWTDKQTGANLKHLARRGNSREINEQQRNRVHRPKHRDISQVTSSPGFTKLAALPSRLRNQVTTKTKTQIEFQGGSANKLTLLNKDSEMLRHAIRVNNFHLLK